MISRKLLLVLFPALLLVLIPQQATTQHEAQTYKTMSYWVTIKECDLKINMMYLTTSADPKMRQIVDHNLIILQWSYDIKKHLDVEGERFSIMDLVAQFGQTIYRIEAMGTGKGGNAFYKALYLSPVGMSPNPIEKAPVREKYTDEWSKEDIQAMLQWISGHNFFPKNLEQKYRTLELKGSLKVDVPLSLKGSPDCKILPRNGEV